MQILLELLNSTPEKMYAIEFLARKLMYSDKKMYAALDQLCTLGLVKCRWAATNNFQGWSISPAGMRFMREKTS